MNTQIADCNRARSTATQRGVVARRPILLVGLVMLLVDHDQCQIQGRE